MKPFAWTPAGNPTTTSPSRIAEPSTSRSRSTSHAGTGEVELVVAVDPGQLGGLAAEQRDAGLATNISRTLGTSSATSSSEIRFAARSRGGRAVGAVVSTSLMRCAARSAPQARRCAPLAREDQLRPDAVGRGREQLAVVERVDPGEGARPAAPVDSTAARSRSTTESAVARDTPATRTSVPPPVGRV